MKFYGFPFHILWKGNFFLYPGIKILKVLNFD